MYRQVRVGGGVMHHAVSKLPIIVLAPESHYPPSKTSDFLDLFKSDSAWAATSPHVQVFEFSTQFFLAVPDSMLATIIDSLKKKEIGLGLTLETSKHDRMAGTICGSAAYSTLKRNVSLIIAKIKAAKGTLAYIALLGPFIDGRYGKAPGECPPSSIETIATTIAPLLQPLLAAYPDAQIGEIEPFPSLTRHPNWSTDYSLWLAAIAARTGKPLQFLQADINWADPLLSESVGHTERPHAIGVLWTDISNIARINKLYAAIIYDGRSDAVSDVGWVTQAESHIEEVESTGITPDEAVFASWHRYPTKALPDTDGGTLTSVVRYYTKRAVDGRTNGVSH